MAIKISNTTVIDDSRNLRNILSASYNTCDGNVVSLISPTAQMDLSVSDAFQITVTANTTFSFINPPAANRSKFITLEITNGGSFAIIWPGSVRWPAGTAPGLTVNGVDVIVFYTDDGGSNYRASLSHKDSK